MSGAEAGCMRSRRSFNVCSGAEASVSIASNAAIPSLASSVAHEFNNILTTIINYARMALRNEGDEAGRTQALEKILKGSQRAATIINSMLGFARNTSTQREETDLVALVEETLVLTEKDFSKHRVHVEKKFVGRPRFGLGMPAGRGGSTKVPLGFGSARVRPARMPRDGRR